MQLQVVITEGYILLNMLIFLLTQQINSNLLKYICIKCGEVYLFREILSRLYDSMDT